MLNEVLKIFLGFVLLVIGADLIVRGSKNIAKRFHIPEILIGLTIVAIGTSMPELIITITSAKKGLGDLIIGNAIGSNLCNILFILGLTAIIQPIKMEKEVKIIHIPFAIFTTICLLSYNDYQVSEFGKYSLLIINNKELRSVYEQDSLVIIKKANEEDYKKGDKILFYSGNPKVVNFINLGEITDVHSENGAQASYYIGDYKLSYDDIIGNVNGSIVYKKAGLILSVIESRWGFMFFVILPTIFFAVYELYEVINEVKKNSKVDLKEKLRKEIEEEMRQDELKKKAKNEKE